MLNKWVVFHQDWSRNEQNVYVRTIGEPLHEQHGKTLFRWVEHRSNIACIKPLRLGIAPSQAGPGEGQNTSTLISRSNLVRSSHPKYSTEDGA